MILSWLLIPLIELLASCCLAVNRNYTTVLVFRDSTVNTGNGNYILKQWPRRTTIPRSKLESSQGHQQILHGKLYAGYARIMAGYQGFCATIIVP